MDGIFRWMPRMSVVGIGQKLGPPLCWEGGSVFPLHELPVCSPQHTLQSSTSAPCRRKRPFTWRRAGDTWTASNPSSRLAPSLTSPTSPERPRSTKVSPPPHSGLPWGRVQRAGGQLGTLLPKCITPSLAPLLPSQGSPVKGGCLRATLPKSSCGPGTPRSAEGPETKSYDRCPSALPAQWAATHRQHKQPGNKDLGMMHPGASGRALALGVSTHKRGRRS